MIPAPLISICIPNYNGMPYLMEAVESALIQSYSNIELIICDNNSEDLSWEYISSLKDERIRAYKNETNLGMVGNFRKVVDLAKGEWILLLGSDDVLKPKCIELLYKNTLNDSSIVFSFSQVDYIGTRQGIGSNWDFDAIIDGNEYITYSLKRGQNLTFLAASLAKTEHVKRNKINDSVFFDWTLWLTMAENNKVAYLNYPLSFYRYHDTNETKIQIKGFYNHYKNLECAIKYYFNFQKTAQIKYDLILHAKKVLFKLYLKQLILDGEIWSNDFIKFIFEHEISCRYKFISFISSIKALIILKLK